MDIRHVNDHYYVSPQIMPEDVEAIAAAGFAAIICNRPDQEVPPGIQAAAVQDAARSAGLAFHILPLTHQTMTPDNIAAQSDLAASAEGKVLAYCASGTRCTVIWALAQAMTHSMSVDDILTKASEAGYALDAMRPQLVAMSQT